MLFLLSAFFVGVISLLYFYLQYKNSYWKRRGVVGPKPSLLVGNYGDYMFLKKELSMVGQDICKPFPDEPFVGTIFGTEPAIMVKDPELIKLILTKDFYYFNGREVSDYTKKDFAMKNLFSESGDYWKVVRQNMTPLFSSAKLKKMFYLIAKCNEVLEKLLEEETKSGKSIEGRSFLTRYTVDCIGTCAFGVDINMMSKDYKDNPFNAIIDQVSTPHFVTAVKNIIRIAWPGLFYGLKLSVFSDDIENFFSKIMFEIFEQRNFKPTERHDLVDSILGFKKNKTIEGDSIQNMKDGERKKVAIDVDDALLASSLGLFFAAGNETSATVLSFTLYELAKKKELQDRAQKEVDEYLRKHNGELVYECINELPFVEACIEETLRFYPVIGILTREVMENYTLPSGVLLEKGMRVHIPLYHIHHSPEHFPAPEEYRPERFLPEERDNVKQYTYFPFGEGPRICLGLRFAKLVMMSAMITIMKKYSVQLADGMPLTIEYDPVAFVPTAKSGLHLVLKPRN